MSATFAARSVHTGERASSPSHPIGRCSEALVSGIEGQPSATRLRGQRPATYCGRRMPPAAALSRRARRGGDSIRPGPAGQTCSRSPAALTQLVSAQIVPGIDVLALSTPTTEGCLQLSRLRLAAAVRPPTSRAWSALACRRAPRCSSRTVRWVAIRAPVETGRRRWVPHPDGKAKGPDGSLLLKRSAPLACETYAYERRLRLATALGGP